MSTPYSQLQKVLASDGQPNQTFGYALALSMYGDLALIGEPGFSGNTGIVSVFRYSYSDKQWENPFNLTADTPTPNDFFGTSIALSADSQVAVIGAPMGNGLNLPGNAYIFVQSDTFLIQKQKLFTSDAVSDYQFGFSTAISSSGHTILIGAPNITEGPPAAAYIFELSDSSWIQQNKFTAPGFGLFGRTVALSPSGNTAFVGADGGGPGALFVFTRSDSTWSQQANLIPTPAKVGADFFGFTGLAFSADEKTVLVASAGKFSDQGAVYAFTSSDEIWVQQQQLLALDGMAGDQFGTSIALGLSPENQDIALISAPVGNKSYIFKRADNVWTQTQVIMASDSDISVNFGNAVSLSGNGLIGLIGASEFSGNQGSAYFFGSQTSTTKADTTSLVSFLPDVLITFILLYGGIVGMFLFNASEE